MHEPITYPFTPFIIDRFLQITANHVLHPKDPAAVTNTFHRAVQKPNHVQGRSLVTRYQSENKYLSFKIRLTTTTAQTTKMNFLVFFSFLLVVVSSLPLEMLRYRRQAYYQQPGWGYNTQRRSGLWRYGGVGGPSGEGSTWEGASIFGISNNDISIFGK